MSFLLLRQVESHVHNYMMVCIKLTIKIDTTDDGILVFWRAGYGFVLEPVEIKI